MCLGTSNAVVLKAGDLVGCHYCGKGLRWHLGTRGRRYTETSFSAQSPLPLPTKNDLVLEVALLGESICKVRILIDIVEWFSKEVLSIYTPANNV